MSLRYGRLFGSTVRIEHECALDLAKPHVALPAPGDVTLPSGRTQLPLTVITEGKDWQDILSSNREWLAGFVYVHPHRGRARAQAFVSIARLTDPSPHLFRFLLLNVLTRQLLPGDVEQRGWIDEAARHQKLIARLDAVITDTEAQAG